MEENEEDDIVLTSDVGGYWPEVALTARIAATLYASPVGDIGADTVFEAVETAADIIRLSRESVDASVKEMLEKRETEHLAERERENPKKEEDLS